jgi:hypothetical protein
MMNASESSCAGPVLLAAHGRIRAPSRKTVHAADRKRHGQRRSSPYSRGPMPSMIAAAAATTAKASPGTAMPSAAR